MTDKEIIEIDGINVLECEHYQYKSLKDCEMRYPESGDCEIGLLNYLFNGNLDIEKYCKDNPNCYFKQLARKTQKYNELLEQHKELDDRANRLIEEKYNLSRECEQIKEKYEALKLENQEGYEIVAELKHECEELKKTVLTKCPNCNSEYLTPKGIELYEENQNLKQECEELKKANVLIDNNRECKAIKLMEIEKLIISCMSGYTDKFTQEIMDIIRKPETVCFENKYEQALDTVSEYIKDNCYSCQGIKYGGCEKCELKRIKEIISKAKG